MFYLNDCCVIWYIELEVLLLWNEAFNLSAFVLLNTRWLEDCLVWYQDFNPCFFKKIFFDVYLIYNVVLISAVQQNYTYIFFHILFYYGLL